MEKLNVETKPVYGRYDRLKYAEDYKRNHNWEPFTEEEKADLMEAIAEITNF